MNLEDELDIAELSGDPFPLPQPVVAEAVRDTPEPWSCDYDIEQFAATMSFANAQRMLSLVRKLQLRPGYYAFPLDPANWVGPFQNLEDAINCEQNTGRTITREVYSFCLFHVRRCDSGFTQQAGMNASV